MELNSSLAPIILKNLIKLGKRKNFFGFDGTFTQEELDCITEITVTDCDSIKGISKLKNLKKLRIVGPNLSSFNETTNINTITDFYEINDLINLKELEIVYDENIEILDISNLSKLKSLRLFCNSNLKIIKGIDNKKSLEHVVICECPIIDLGDIENYINNTMDTSINILDIKMYAQLFSNSNIRTLLKNKYNMNSSNIRFGEHIYFHDEIYTLDIYQIQDLYVKVKKILANLNLEKLDKEQQIYYIYKFVISYLKYDYDGLNYRNKNYQKLLESSLENKKYILRRMAIINSSFGALNSKKAVCDGYVNLFRLILSFLDIPSQTVICKKNDMTHAAIKYYYNGVWHYCDPEKDRDVNAIKFFDLTREEIEKIYELSPKEYIEQVDGVKNYEKHFN